MKRYEICGRQSSASKEDRIVARACGEDPSLLSKTLPGIPHVKYRVMIVREAFALSKNPSTKEYFKAKAKVDKALVERGIGIVIPSARPGRITR